MDNADWYDMKGRKRHYWDFKGLLFPHIPSSQDIKHMNPDQLRGKLVYLVTWATQNEYLWNKQTDLHKENPMIKRENQKLFQENERLLQENQKLKKELESLKQFELDKLLDASMCEIFTTEQQFLKESTIL
jgi:predicted nuclease with TOPRIM domain